MKWVPENRCQLRIRLTFSFQRFAKPRSAMSWLSGVAFAPAANGGEWACRNRPGGATASVRPSFCPTLTGFPISTPCAARVAIAVSPASPGPMPSRVRLIALPSRTDSLAKATEETPSQHTVRTATSAASDVRWDAGEKAGRRAVPGDEAFWRFIQGPGTDHFSIAQPRNRAAVQDRLLVEFIHRQCVSDCKVPP